MNRHHNAPTDSRQELPQWADRYARNRVLPVIVLMVWVVIYSGLLSLGLGILLVLVPRGGNPVLIALAAIYVLVLFGGITWLTVTGRSSSMLENVAKRIYQNEGSAVPVTLGQPVSSATERYRGMIYGFLCPWLWLLLMYIFLHVFHVPSIYLLPAMATVVVPLMVWQAMIRADNPKWLGMIVPALYAIHAILVLAGMRLSVFVDKESVAHTHGWPTGNQIMDVVMPLNVYMLLSLLIKHIYNRYALLKLQVAALSPSSELEEADGQDGFNRCIY